MQQQFIKLQFKKQWLTLSLLCSLWVSSSSLYAQSSGDNDKYALNFVNADISAVVSSIGSFTKKTYVVDPRVRGTITLVSPEPLSQTEANNALLAALRLQGFTIVESGNVARVVPENDAKTQAETVNPKNALNKSENMIVTQVFQLKNESVTGLVPILRPLITPNNVISAYPNNNTIVITDYADNLKRIEAIITNLDEPTNNDLEIIPVHHALAIDIAAIVNKLLDEGSRSTGAAIDAGQRLTLVADQRTNSLLIRGASKSRLQRAKKLIQQLDQPTQQAGNVWVVHLKNAEAARLARTLQAILSNTPFSEDEFSSDRITADTTKNLGTTPTNDEARTAVGSNSPESGGIVQADTATNSLIITAPEPVYRNLRTIIEQLDVRRAQVFVESLIVEVSSDKAAEFGIQFQGLSGVSRGGSQLIGGTNFTTPGSGTNILGAAANLGAVGRGLNIGVINGEINIPGVGTISNLGFLARALESKADANILSTPNILTLDNEEAKIVIGQNVPFITGQFTNTGNTNNGTVNPFQTIERQDVGLTLKVKPQVSDGGTVKLGIYQEVSSVVDSSNDAGVITNKRSIESNVLVENGNIIVLGGLVEDRVNGTEEKVPGLGDIPFLGNLFRYDNRRRVKTNLMVFLRPVVVRSENDSSNLVADRYDYMRETQANQTFKSRPLLPSLEGPVLPKRPQGDEVSSSNSSSLLYPGDAFKPNQQLSNQANTIPEVDQKPKQAKVNQPSVIPKKTEVPLVISSSNSKKTYNWLNMNQQFSNEPKTHDWLDQFNHNQAPKTHNWLDNLTSKTQ